MSKVFGRFDVVALSVVGVCVAGLYGAALPDLLRGAEGHGDLGAVSGTISSGVTSSGSTVSGLVPAAPTARLMTTTPPRADSARADSGRLARGAATGVLVDDDALDVAAVQRLYDDLAYALDSVRDDAEGVPRLFLARVPSDLQDIHNVDERKSLFLRTALPLILKVNEDILTDRRRLEALIASGRKLSALTADDRRWVEEKARQYRLASPDMRKLLARIDIIPPSLALAQGAEESGWGTSRFARQGNALFGQWTTEGDAGIVPLRRQDGMSHIVKAFPTLLAAVEGYARNLNSHPAYGEFRTRRAALRAADKPLDGMELARTLLRYSERGADYVDTLHVIMRVNDLPALDSAALRSLHDDIEVASLSGIKASVLLQ